MATHGKSINLFLMDGDPSGRIKCTLANWTGVAYKIPRTELEKCKNLDILKQRAAFTFCSAHLMKPEMLSYISAKLAYARTEKVFSCVLTSISKIPIRTTGPKQ